jgi:UV DNA damage endonuclease
MKTRLGYCCISLGEHESSFKTTTLTSVKKLKDARPKLEDIWRHNLAELEKILNYNRTIGVHLFRITSNMFPLADHQDYEHIWEKFKDNPNNFTQTKKIVADYISHDGRLVAHPSQFVSLGADSKETRKNSIHNLEHHGEVFDLLDLSKSTEAALNIHLSSGRKGAESLLNFEKSLAGLSKSVSSRLVFETEDKSFWTWQKIAKYFPEYPITLDFHHRNINNEGENVSEAFDACVDSWRGKRPLMHISAGRTGEKDRKHHDWVHELPDEVCNYPVDLEIEAKQKDLAVLNLMRKYHNCLYVHTESFCP